MSESRTSRKRKRTDQDPLHWQNTRKRQKLGGLPSSQSQARSAFWDNLSQVWLTKSALRELDRRNRQHTERSLYLQARRPVTRNLVAAWEREHLFEPDTLDSCTAEDLREIAQFARHGGPDISNLRGYLEPDHPLDRTMSSSEPSLRGGRPRGNKSASGSRTKPTTNTTKSTGPYDRNFEQKLIDGGVFPNRYRFEDGLAAKPDNWEEMNQRAIRHRASLSPSRFSDRAHEEFIQADADAKKEHLVTTSVIPIIAGKIQDASCVSGKVPFRNLACLTDDELVPGSPDLYYGARPAHLNRRVRDDLSDQIIPSTQYDLPVAPNFFLAVKGPDGTPAVAGRQALYDGTLGERGQISLESWGQNGTVFDNKAHTITSLYSDGTLKMYSIHAAQPNGPDSRPEYYMHQIDAWAMTGNPRSFRDGASAFRNLREYAEEQRNGAIRRANVRADKVNHDAVDAVDAVDGVDEVVATSNSTSSALVHEQESETITNDTCGPPPAKRPASPPTQSRRREFQ